MHPSSFTAVLLPTGHSLFRVVLRFRCRRLGVLADMTFGKPIKVRIVAAYPETGKLRLTIQVWDGRRSQYRTNLPFDMICPWSCWAWWGRFVHIKRVQWPGPKAGGRGDIERTSHPRLRMGYNDVPVHICNWPTCRRQPTATWRRTRRAGSRCRSGRYDWRIFRTWRPSPPTHQWPLLMCISCGPINK
jgi:hypothetical protein